MIFAPVLQDVAARMAGVPAGFRDDPVRAAYRLRDAIALVRPDWVVTHHDPRAEADVVRAAGTDIEMIDLTLAESPPVSAYVELTRVLAALYPGHTIAASITGPAGMAGALAGAPGGLADNVLDCGDMLAELISAYVRAGASRILVWEPASTGAPFDAVREAHTPLVRKLRTLGIPGVLCGGADMADPGYPARALPGRGVGAALMDPECFEDHGEPLSFDAVWRKLSEGHEIGPGQPGQAPALISNGPVPEHCSMHVLRAAGQRPGSVS